MNPLAIFTGPYALIAKWAVLGLLCLALFAFGWVKGDEHGTQKLVDYVAGQVKEAVRINTARQAATAKVVTEYVQVAGKTEVVTQTITKEVFKYADANPGYCLDAAWGRLHDAAALNTVPEPGPAPDGAGGAPKAAAALDAVTGNYAACHRTADRLDALQGWVRAQQAVK